MPKIVLFKAPSASKRFDQTKAVRRQREKIVVQADNHVRLLQPIFWLGRLTKGQSRALVERPSRKCFPLMPFHGRKKCAECVNLCSQSRRGNPTAQQTETLPLLFPLELHFSEHCIEQCASGFNISFVKHRP